MVVPSTTCCKIYDKVSVIFIFGLYITTVINLPTNIYLSGRAPLWALLLYLQIVFQLLFSHKKLHYLY